MVTKKSVAMCIVLTIVTCGIYGIYWMYCLAEDMNTLANDNGISGGMMILLSFVTCSIYLFYWMYKCGERLDSVKQERGIPSGNSGILYLLFAVFGLGIISYALIQDEINKIADL